MNRMIEFGFWLPVAFVFVNLVWGWMLNTTPPPMTGSDETFGRIDLEAGIPLEGAKLVTPQLAKKIPVS